MCMQTFETNVVEIAGEKVVRSRFGTFTGEKETSIPEKFEQTVQVEGLTVWRSNGEVPFSDMLLDFVSLGKITFEQAEFSALQRKKDSEASLATLFPGGPRRLHRTAGLAAPSSLRPLHLSLIHI